MRKIAVMFGLLLLAASIVVPVASSANYSSSNSGVEGNFVGTLVADGGPRPPLPPLRAFDGSPRPPLPPTANFDGSPRPPLPPGAAFDGSPRPPLPPASLSA
jgi:hypothetical protein